MDTSEASVGIPPFLPLRAPPERCIPILVNGLPLKRSGVCDVGVYSHGMIRQTLSNRSRGLLETIIPTQEVDNAVVHVHCPSSELIGKNSFDFNCYFNTYYNADPLNPDARHRGKQ